MSILQQKVFESDELNQKICTCTEEMVLKFKERLNSKSAKHKTKIQEYKQLY